MAKETEDEVTRFSLYLPAEAYNSLLELQKRTNKRSLAETIRAALKFYAFAEEARASGKDVIFEDRKTKMRERIVEL